MRKSIQRLTALSLLLTSMYSNEALAQKNYSLPDGKVVIARGVSGYQSVKLKVKNDASSTIRLQWEIISNTVSTVSGWEVSFCDLNNCYTPGQIPGYATSTLASQTTIPFSIDIETNGYTGTGEMVFTMKEEGSTEPADTLTLRATSSVGIQAFINGKPDGVTVYPNPIADDSKVMLSGIQANEIASIRLTSMDGKIYPVYVVGSGANAGTEIAIPNIGAGAYLLEMTNRKGESSHQKVIKR